MLSRFLFLSATACVALTSCMTETYLHVRETPELRVPEQVRRIAIVDRCRFFQTAVWFALDDRRAHGKLTYNYGVLNCLNGLRENWEDNHVADSIFVPYNVELKGMEHAGEIPAALDWETVTKLCARLHADALLVLESYEADYTIEYPSRSSQNHQPMVLFNDSAGNTIYNLQPAPIRPARARFDVTSVWRMYDPRSKTILSELHQSNTVNISPQYDDDDSWFPPEQQMREQAGESAGRQTAQLIHSQWKAVSRSYYTSGSKTIRKGASYAKDGNWEAAASEWRHSTAVRHKRKAARACLNMAIAAEKQGRIDLAEEWARQAQSKGNKTAGNYLAQLQRIEEVGK